MCVAYIYSFDVFFLKICEPVSNNFTSDNFGQFTSPFFCILYIIMISYMTIILYGILYRPTACLFNGNSKFSKI